MVGALAGASGCRLEERWFQVCCSRSLRCGRSFGGPAAAPYDHAVVQVAGMVGRKVSEAEFRGWIGRTGLRQADARHWVDAGTGRVVAWMVVRSLGGEEDFDYYVAAIG